ncbi:MAG: enoyl-CoA hydratase-related protein [Pseudonocardia sp.]|nr:enoyl-CoA hydratase-related protein [Pseudonocardia sp.]
MKILLLCSAFNGLTQRVWTELREDGHQLDVRLAGSEDGVRRAVADTDPDLVLCPFLKDRVPEDVWRRHRVVVLHPGPVGDRGPSSIDWAITEGASEWGVTALQAIEEMDAGPIWGTRTFAMPQDADGPSRKSSVYNGPVTEAAVELAREVVAKAGDPGFVPQPLVEGAPGVVGRLRPTMVQADRAFAWTDPTAHILRRIRAADGAPGVRTVLAGLEVFVHDATPGDATPGEPGTVAAVRHGSALVRTGDGALWIGRAKVPRGVKLPTATVLGELVAEVPESLDHPVAEGPAHGPREISYRRVGDVGVVRADLHNGAMSAGQGHRLLAVLRHAVAQDTRVLVFEGGETFSNGIHLNVAEAAAHPAAESWRNITAIDDVCRELITCTHQLVVAAIGGNAGAGGVMLALGADRVVASAGTVLNPHYRSMGLTGSEYWTYVLPRRVGSRVAERLTSDCLPVGTAEALRIGLIDDVLPGPRPEFDATVLAYAAALAADPNLPAQLAAKQAGRAADEHVRPLEAYRVQELAEMSRDMFDDRYGYADARHAFVTKAKKDEPGSVLAVPRQRDPEAAPVLAV